MSHVSLFRLFDIKYKLESVCVDKPLVPVLGLEEKMTLILTMSVLKKKKLKMAK